MDSTAAPDTVVLGSAPGWSAGDIVRFETEDGPLVYLADGASEAEAGVKERLVRRSDIAPYPNLLQVAGVSDDLSDVTGGVPTGTVVGAAEDVDDPTVTQTTDELYVQNGTSSAFVSADAGAYIETAEIDLSGEGYASAWVNLRVIAGSVRLSLVDADGAQFPATEEAIGVADIILRGLAIGGLAPAPANHTLRLTALEDGTEFVLDSWTLTRSSPDPTSFSGDMGPIALWRAGAGILLREGGVQPARLDAQWVDFSVFDEDVDRPEIGAQVSVKDAGVDTDVRMIELRRRLAGGVEQIAGKFGERRLDLSDFVRPSLRRGRGPQVDPKPRVGGGLAPDAVRWRPADAQVVIQQGQVVRTYIFSYALEYGTDVRSVRYEQFWIFPDGTEVQVIRMTDPAASTHDLDQDVEDAPRIHIVEDLSIDDVSTVLPVSLRVQATPYPEDDAGGWRENPCRFTSRWSVRGCPTLIRMATCGPQAR